MNQWKVILEALRKHYAYEGDGSLADVQRFIKEADIGDMIRFAKEGETLESVHAKSKKKPILVLANGDEEEDEAQDDGDEDKPKVKTPQGPAAKRHRIADPNKPDRPVDAKSWARNIDRKVFERKAKRGQTNFESADQAELFSVWFKSVIIPNSMNSDDWGLLQKANIGTTFTAGGSTIPDDFLPTMIDLKEKYGVARQVCAPIPMSRDTLTMPKRTGGLTVYAPGEGGTITQSNPTTGSVNLTAVKMATYTEVSSELLNDSAISFGDFVAGEIAQAFSQKEDDCFFTGDGTAADFNIAGFTTKFLALGATRSSIAGLFVGTGNQWSELVLTDFENVCGLAPAYTDMEPGLCWVMHKRFYHAVCVRLALAAGGVPAAEIKEGLTQPRFLGYPVKFAQVMNRDNSSAGIQDLIPCMFGAFNLAAKIGDVRGGMEIAQSEHAAFATDCIAIRGKQRVALTVHDIGNYTSTVASQEPGPVVGLLGAAS